MRGLLCLASLSVASLPLNAQTLRWSDPATWGGALPRAGAVVTIPAGRTVLLDTTTAALAGLRIQGALVADDRDVAITSEFILVDGGRLEIGTAATPFRRRAVITLTGTRAGGAGDPMFGRKALAVHGGTLALHGRPSAAAWVRLGADAAAGATTITLAEAPGWQAGDRIVLATSSSRMQEFDDNVIAAISGTQITLQRPLAFRHRGVVRTVGSRAIDMRAEVGVLSHNIVVEGDAGSEAERFGGHAMFMHGVVPAVIQLADVEFRRMGQLNSVGRYPVHFHLMGATQGSYLRRTAIHSTIQRGLVLHGVSGIDVAGNVLFNTVGHNVVVEDARTTGNRLTGNLALVNRQPSPLHTDPVLQSQNDRLPSNFWLKSGRNTVVGNSAAGSTNSGINFDGIDASGPLDVRQNTMHAAMGLEGAGAGDFDLSAGLMLLGNEEARPTTDRIADNLVYHNTIGAWPEETDHFVLDGLVAVENDLHTENRGVGLRVTYRDAFFVGALEGPVRGRGGIVHFQYGSDVTLLRPTFANSAGASIASATDVAEELQASLTITDPRVIGTPPASAFAGDHFVTYTDGALLPAGTYVGAPRFATSACTAVAMPIEPGESLQNFRCPRRFRYAELDFRDRSAPGTRLHGSTALRRSDGVRVTGGMFGTSVVLDGGLTYDIERPSTAGYALRLSDDVMDGVAGALGAALLPVRLPAGSGVPAVFRTAVQGATPPVPGAAQRLRPATSAADFAANPATTYLHEAASGLVTVQVSAGWVVVQPNASVAACPSAPSRRVASDAARQFLLAYAQGAAAADLDRDGKANHADFRQLLRARRGGC